MELKPGYKQTEVGVIPEDWDSKQIGGEIDLLTGHPFPSSGYSESGIRLLRGSNVKRGETDWNEEITQYWPSVSPEIVCYELRRGDLVIAMDGSLVGRSFAQLSSDDLPALLLQRVARIRSTKLDITYLTAFVGSDCFIKYADSVKTVTAIPHISPGDIRKFTIPIPPTLFEQEAIAAALSDVDALLDSLDQLITKKRNLKQAAMQQLLTGKTRLPGFVGEWEVKRLGDIAHIKTGSRNNQDKVDDGEYPFFVRSATVERINSYSHNCEAILIPGEGNIGSIFHYINGCFDVHQRVYAITQFLSEVSGKYIYLYMSVKFGFHAMQNSVKATVDSLRLPTFHEFQLALPPTIEEQSAIAILLSDMDTEIEAIEQRRTKTHHLKQAMMQELLTGKTRLVDPIGALR